MGKREIASKISTGIPAKYSFADALLAEHFCVARGLEDLTLSLFTTLVEIQHLYEEFNNLIKVNVVDNRLHTILNVAFFTHFAVKALWMKGGKKQVFSEGDYCPFCQIQDLTCSHFAEPGRSRSSVPERHLARHCTATA